MHKLVKAVGRRSAGIAAGVVLTGGLAGGVLLTPGTAYADTMTATTTTITGVTQAPGSSGTTLTVNVSVSPNPGGGNFNVSGAGGCSAGLGTSGTGTCNIYGVAAGGYSLAASFGGWGGFGASGPSSPFWVRVSGPPANTLAWSSDSPSLNAQAGQNYSATFRAVGSPGIRYSLNGGFSGLYINSYSGTVSGRVPNSGNSFGYSVTATNGFGQTITTGWYTVYIRHFFNGHASLSTSLSCTSPVFTGTKGHCTLSVTNNSYGYGYGYGNGNASNVNAQIALPRQLQADYCGYYYFNNFGCSISGNTASENLGTLYPGQTKSLTVTFTARTGFFLWGWHHGYRFTVKVVGSASSGGFQYFRNGQSTSVAYVTIIPRGFWAA
jgi:hypothetical protein